MKDTKPTETVASRLELVKSLADVQSRLRSDITSDFVYAKLEEKDRQLIIEMTNNAYLVSTRLKLNLKSYKEWKWNNRLEQWELKYLEKDRKEILIEQIKNIFDVFMIRPMMIAILKRNVEGNFLVKGSMKQEDEIEEESEQEIGDFKKAIKGLLGNEQKK